MKKFLLLVLIITLFCCGVFLLGWTQIKVRPGSFGVVISKTGGINKTPVLNGTFSFHPEFLLPTNAELRKFSLKPYTATKVFTGELPSADFYSANDTFSFKYSFTFSFESHTTPEKIISLLENSKISNSDDVYAYLERTSDAIIQDAVSVYLKNASENIGFIPESLTVVDLFKACNFEERYPYVEIDVLSLVSVALPDYELYHYLRNNLISGRSEAKKIEPPIIENQQNEEKIDDENKTENIEDAINKFMGDDLL